MTRRYRSGRRSLYVRPKLIGRPLRRLTSPIHATSARVLLSGSSSRSPSRIAPSKTPRAGAAEHVGERQQLVGGGLACPGPGVRRARGAGTSGWSRSRARRPPSPPRPARTSRRCRRPSPEPSSSPRSPIASTRSAQWPTSPPALRPFGMPVEPAEVLAVRLPVPRQAVEDRSPGDVLDALHHLGEVRSVPGRHGANVTPQLPSTTLVTPCQHDGRRQRVPRQLGVEVRVDVDEAGRDDAARGVDLAAAVRRRLLDGDDAIAGDRDVGRRRRRAGAVDDRAARESRCRRPFPSAPRRHLPAPAWPDDAVI